MAWSGAGRIDRLGLVLVGLGVLPVACVDAPSDPQQTDTTGSSGEAGSSSTTDTGMLDTTGSSSSTSGGSTDEGTTTEGMIDPYDTDVVWTPCSLYTGGAGEEAECAEIPLPIDWSDPQGETLTVFVKRVGNPAGDKQLWMLMGGPGGAGAGFESFAETFVDADDQLMVYLPDHRGVGRSTRLGCELQEAPGSDEGLLVTMDEWPACIDAIEQQWGADLQHLTTSAASRDLGWLVDKLRGDQAVHVYGGSYGTYWAHRYLQIFEDQPDSISLVGIAPPDFDFALYVPQYDAAGRRFMDRCSEDPVCAGRLGPDAQATMEQILGQVDGGLCPGALAAGLDRATLKLFFSVQLSWAWNERALIPAILYRLQRCDPADVAALSVAAPQMMNPLAALYEDPLFSRSTNNHISLSEMWHSPVPTPQQVQEAEANAIFGIGAGEQKALLAPVWPTYEPDDFALTYAENDVPMLMMVGEFDPNTPLPLGEDFAQHFTGANQHFVELPNGNHTWDSPTSGGFGCGINVFFSFIQDPTGPLLDCTGDVLPVNFAGTPGLAQAFFGTNDLYDN